MALSWLFSVSIFLWVTAITPGPNNMLLTSSGANFGFIRSMPLTIGIMAGMQALLILVSLGIGSFLLAFPLLHTVLKVLGSLYLLWIAWSIASSRYEPHSDRGEQVETIKPLRLHQGFLLQFLNPKAWLMVLGAVASYSLPGSQYVFSIVVISCVLAVINFIAGLVWLGFGSLIGRLLNSRNAWFTFNVSMGLLTALCVIFIWI